MRDPYAELGVSSHASAEEIKAANARSGAAFDRALNEDRRQPKRSRNA